MEVFFVIMFGLVFGSFLNVCIYRLPKEQSIVKPGSFCPKCKAPIHWYDNLPVLSYILLGGKCRACKAKISLRYPVIELLTAAIFLMMFLRFGLSANFVKYAFFFTILVLVSTVDIDYHAIPVYFCFIGIGVGLLFGLGETIRVIRYVIPDLNYLPICESFKGLIFGFGFAYLFKFFGDIFLGLYLHWRKIESIEGETESLGLGDVDFLGMVGVFLGIKGAMLSFFIAPFAALAYALFAVIFRKSHLIPYLPYLSIGCLVAFFWGDAILSFIL
jgi:leader peptidase (prepilin peptidase)/N-methyltransferase